MRAGATVRSTGANHKVDVVTQIGEPHMLASVPAYSGSLASAGFVTTSIALGRTPARIYRPREPAQLRLAFALHDALSRLLVKVRGHRG